MKKIVNIIVFLMFLQMLTVNAQDTLIFKGQFSNWILYNTENASHIWAGSRYIPQLNYSYKLEQKRLIDFEASANLFATMSVNSDSINIDENIKPYRLWARYSGKQFELRAGLQKINFGSATMLRPLMWFDQMDPQDPLSLTDGVWGVLGRYYFLNNANVWLWALYGNEKARSWETIDRNKNYPEGGGRVQFPFSNSEIGLSYHHQILDMRTLNKQATSLFRIPENKMGLDVKIDWIIGLWFEGLWSVKDADLGMFTNQEIITLGTDYTFGVGSGLYVASEHLIAANDENAFEFQNTIHFSAFTVSYPIGLFDNLGLMFYYDWGNESIYNFINWQKQFNRTSLHVMAYWNPENSQLPTAGSETNLFGGKGIQIMFVFNH